MALTKVAKSLLKRSPRPASMSLPPGSDMSQAEAPKVVTVAIIGCGQRGRGYGEYALQFPKSCRVVAIAEPRDKTRAQMAKDHQVDTSLVFSSWKDLYKASSEMMKELGNRLADAVIITVQDHMHAEVVMAFAKHGYHILCEKPMATDINDCLKMTEAVKKAGVIFGMGHVLRYTAYNAAITEIIRSESLGKLINIVHMEPVGHWHFAHSFVRGNWGNEQKSSFSLMTKSCHDIDLLCHWFNPSTPVKVSSFGSLQHFKKSAKPPAAGDATRCLDCAYESECPYSAKKIYLDPLTRGHTRWPVSVLVDGLPDIENITEALNIGPYGKCVYETDNDVVDHQVVNLQFSSGATCSFTMVAFTSLICDRQTRFHFSHGEIVGDMNTFTVTDFRMRSSKPVLHKPNSDPGVHGGGDIGLVRAFLEAVRTGKQDKLGTDVDEVLKSHLTVFAAEESRRKGKVVDIEDFEKDVKSRLQVN